MTFLLQETRGFGINNELIQIFFMKVSATEDSFKVSLMKESGKLSWFVKKSFLQYSKEPVIPRGHKRIVNVQ